MTDTETIPDAATTTTDWDAEFVKLQTRFPKIKPTILFAFHVLQLNPDIELDDLKAQAKLHDLRVTAASVNAARRLLDRNPATAGKVADAAPKAADAEPRRTRQRRDAQGPLDVDALIRSTVAKVQAQGDAEAESLRSAMRKAIGVLEAASR